MLCSWSLEGMQSWAIGRTLWCLECCISWASASGESKCKKKKKCNEWDKKINPDLHLGKTNVKPHWSFLSSQKVFYFLKSKEEYFCVSQFSLLLLVASLSYDSYTLNRLANSCHTLQSSRPNCRNCLNKKYLFHWVANATSFPVLRLFLTAWWTLWRMCSTSWLSTYSSCSSLLWWQCSSSRVVSFSALMNPKSLSVTAG